MFDGMYIYIDIVTAYLEELKDQLQRDSVCVHVMQLCTKGWPTHNTKEPALKSLWAEPGQYKMGYCLRDKDLIASTMRNYVIAKL